MHVVTVVTIWHLFTLYMSMCGCSSCIKFCSIATSLNEVSMNRLALCMELHLNFNVIVSIQ